MSDYEFYLVEKKPPVAWVYLNRPGKRNAMHPPAWKETIPIFEDLSADRDIRAVILTGKGACFSAGIDFISMSMDLPELMNQDQKGGTKWSLLRKVYRMQDTMTAIERCTKPVIAAIHGHCIGAGLDMAAVCDVRLCSADTLFSLKEAAVGIVADVGGLQRLPAIIGQGLTRELAYTAKDIDAARALEMHLVNQVYESHETLLEGALQMATEIAGNSPLAVQAAKEVLNESEKASVERGLKYVASISTNILPSHDFMEAMAAFMEKRKPEFKGE